MKAWLDIIGLLLLYLALILLVVTAAWIMTRVAINKHIREIEGMKAQEPIDNIVFYGCHGEKVNLDERIKNTAAEIRQTIKIAGRSQRK